MQLPTPEELENETQRLTRALRSWETRSMKFVVCSLFLAACGRSECQDYATVACGKLSLCVTPVNETACEADTAKQIQAQHRTESDCKTTREKIQNMGCAEFTAYVNSKIAR